ncbi:MAG: putative porin [Elusimicrobia bacterium]|nr:putative porin [Elusimicrobiota bacterium]
MKRVLWILISCIVLMSNKVSFASEIDMLVNKLAEKNLITYGEAQQIITESKETVRKEIAMGKAETMPAWIQNLSIKGDLRLRHQVDWDSSKSYARIRERLRLRTGFETRVVENVKAGFGIATGSESTDLVTSTSSTSGYAISDAECTSTNHTFAGLGKAMLMVDYAYLQYEPVSWITITGGKMKSGTEVWNTTDLLWDTDINPDGVAVNVNKSINEKLGILLNGSWLAFGEKSSTLNAPDAYIIQPGVSYMPASNISIKAAYAVQSLNVNGKKISSFLGTPAFDYNASNISLEAKMSDVYAGYCVKLYGDTVSNGDSKVTKDKEGHVYGIKIGDDKVSEFGKWELVYLDRYMETNAWLSKLEDSDSYGGVTNQKGYEIIFNMGLTKSLVLGIDYYSMDKITGATKTTPKQLAQVDMVYKF